MQGLTHDQQERPRVTEPLAASLISFPAVLLVHGGLPVALCSQETAPISGPVNSHSNVWGSVSPPSSHSSLPHFVPMAAQISSPERGLPRSPSSSFYRSLLLYLDSILFITPINTCHIFFCPLAPPIEPNDMKAGVLSGLVTAAFPASGAVAGPRDTHLTLEWCFCFGSLPLTFCSVQVVRR